MSKGITEKQWFAGVDWASANYRVCLTETANASVSALCHGGVGLAEMANWLIVTNGGAPNMIHVAIECATCAGET
jgi:hypothetical protein